MARQLLCAASLVLICAAACGNQSGLICSSADQCDPGEGCVEGQCAAGALESPAATSISVSPSAQTISASVGQTPPSASVTLTNLDTSSHPLSLACSGAGATPASATLTLTSKQSAALSIHFTAPTASGSQVGTCTAKSSTGKTTWATFTITVVASANSGGGSGGGSSGGSAGGAGGGAGGGSGGSGGSAGTGVGPTGGTVDHLYFAVVGDSRPPNIDETSSYPSAIIGKIYKDIEGLSPRPQFAVGTGDYMYANTSSGTAQPQANLYVAARAAFAGTVFEAMGNHECNGYTADNCTSLTATDNIKAFMGTILAPLGQPLPYYSVPISAPDNSWTAKIVVVACNYWSAAEQTWLTSTLAKPTTYTILVRHEPAAANTAPCVSAVESTMKKSSYDLSLVGHTHEFHGSASSKEIIVGNGGAPLTAGSYGFTTVERLSSGWQIKNYDYASVLPTTTYTIP